MTVFSGSDDKGAYIAAGSSTYTDQFWGRHPYGRGQALWWMEIPCAPRNDQVATVQIEETPPFEDLPIQDQ
jgi:hypothetical protein